MIITGQDSIWQNDMKSGHILFIIRKLNDNSIPFEGIIEIDDGTNVVSAFDIDIANAWIRLLIVDCAHAAETKSGHHSYYSFFILLNGVIHLTRSC
jgi:hypothetical protein